MKLLHFYWYVLSCCTSEETSKKEKKKKKSSSRQALTAGSLLETPSKQQCRLTQLRSRKKTIGAVVVVVAFCWWACVCVLKRAVSREDAAATAAAQGWEVRSLFLFFSFLSLFFFSFVSHKSLQRLQRSTSKQNSPVFSCGLFFQCPTFFNKAVSRVLSFSSPLSPSRSAARSALVCVFSILSLDSV